MYELCESHLGWMIRKPARRGWLYLSRLYRGKTKWVLDYTYARHYKQASALLVIDRLEKGVIK